jgi:dihydroorotase
VLLFRDEIYHLQCCRRLTDLGLVVAQPESITIRRPFDSHVHLRRGSILRAVISHTAKRFGRGIIMPNTEPPIDTLEAATEYKSEIKVALPAESDFEPLMTLYLTRSLSPQSIERAARVAGDRQIFGVKYYPWGATTNSQWGPRNILDAKDILHSMEEVGLPLLLHGEVHINQNADEEDPYIGEELFIKEILPRLIDGFPKLRVSLEHLSSAVGAEFMEKHGTVDRLVATVTPHHLIYDRRHAFAGGYRTLLSCKPLIKAAGDRERLRDLVGKGLPFVSAGTDTAPHTESYKFSSCCAYGVFNAPVAVELYTQVFEDLRATRHLESFLSINGPRFYGLEADTKTITLVKRGWQIAEPVVTEEGENIWPLCHIQHGLGNEIVRWSLKEEPKES